MVVLLISLCLLYSALTDGLNISIKSCDVDKKPYPIDTSELPDSDFVGHLETTLHGGVAIDPCTYREQSILGLSWNNSDEVSSVSQTLCLTLTSITKNLTRCFRLSSIKKMRSRITCWIVVSWLNAIPVYTIVAYVLNDSWTELHSGQELVSNNCRNICEENFPRHQSVMVLTCDVVTKIDVTYKTDVTHINLVPKTSKEEERHPVTFIQSKITSTDGHIHSEQYTIELYIRGHINHGEYNLEISGKIDTVPQDHSCIWEIPVIVYCDIRPTIPIHEPQATPQATYTQRNTLTLVLVIGSSVGVASLLVTIAIVFQVCRKRRTPENDVIEQPAEMRRLNVDTTYV